MHPGILSCHLATFPHHPAPQFLAKHFQKKPFPISPAKVNNFLNLKITSSSKNNPMRSSHRVTLVPGSYNLSDAPQKCTGGILGKL